MSFEEIDKEVKWEDLLTIWKHCCIYNPILTEEMPVEIIKCKANTELSCIYGYDFILKNEVQERRKNIDSFFLFGTPTNKGTLQTINMLRSSKDDEERMAIWCAAFAKDMLEKGVRLNQSKNYLYWLSEKCENFLRERFYIWHHAMKRLTPDIYYGYHICDGIKIKSWQALIELIALNAKMVLQDYQLVLYSSLGENEASDKLEMKFNMRIDKA
ncbi:MAG: hypothetical protein NC311_07385 [Muribaculaceae bacterium]|nr:hypothetical protein [Muribaculaceae bacterium]